MSTINNELSISDQGLKLLEEVEQCRLEPYDDQTGKKISAWTAGATIGVGHLISQAEWDHYRNGLSAEQARDLFKKDLAPFIEAVRKNINVGLQQQQFDALVMLVFNIGAGNFSTSSVVKLVNNPAAKTGYPNLEAAWKAWNKSQGKVMKGLDNRRACEWDVYSQGVYRKKW
ncbi:MAG: lysozyme [Gammaproteobacteria bacterium]